MMTLFHFTGVRVVWNCISNSCSFQSWYKNWGRWTFWRAISISKMACFWSNLHYIAHSSTHGFWTLTRAHGLMKVQAWLKWMEIVNYGKRNPNHVKFWILTFSAHYGRNILKCSNWPGSYAKLLKSNFEHFKMLTRAHVCVVTRTRTWIVSVLTNDLKFMCIEFGQFMMNGYKDMNDHVKTQNGAWMTSWLSDHTEKRRSTIPDDGKYTVKIWGW